MQKTAEAGPPIDDDDYEWVELDQRYRFGTLADWLAMLAIDFAGAEVRRVGRHWRKTWRINVPIRESIEILCRDMEPVIHETVEHLSSLPEIKRRTERPELVFAYVIPIIDNNGWGIVKLKRQNLGIAMRLCELDAQITVKVQFWLQAGRIT